MGGSDRKHPNCRALVLMREVLGWDQGELGKAIGMTARQVSDLERGRPIPTRGDLLRCAREMGLPDTFVDRTFAYRQSARPGGPPGATEAAIEIDRLAAELAGEFETTLRRTLTRAYHGAIGLVEKQLAAELWARLRPLTPAERQFQVEADLLYHRWGLAVFLAHESADAAADDHGRARELAQLAAEIAGRLQGGEPWPSRVQGYVGAFLGNAQRVGGELPAAARTLIRARHLWEAGATADPGLLDESRFLSLEASLLRDQRRLPEAVARLEEALRLARPESVARLLVQKGRTLEEMDDYEGAVAALFKAIPLIDGGADPRLAWAARFNLCENLFQLGRHEEAAPLFPEIRELAIQLGNGLDLLRLRWLEGRIAALRRRWREAAEILAEVRDGFLARGIPFDAALASLELATVLLEEERTAEVKETTRLLAPLFGALEVDREALASLQLFCEAAERENATLAEARRLCDLLRRTRRQAGRVPELPE